MEYDHCSHGNDAEEIVDLLLEAGADPNGRNDDNRTALHLAAADFSLHGSRSPLEGGADPNSQDDDGDTPLPRGSGPRRYRSRCGVA